MVWDHTRCDPTDSPVLANAAVSSPAVAQPEWDMSEREMVDVVSDFVDLFRKDLCPQCPVCGGSPFRISHTQAFCIGQDCAALMWNPRRSAVDNLENTSTVDLDGPYALTAGAVLR